MLCALLLGSAGFAAAAIGSHGRLFSVLTGTSSTSSTMTSTTPGQRWVTICHRTGSSTHRWHTLTVAQAAVAAHLRHGDQLAACVTATVTTASTTTSPNPVTHGKSGELDDSDSGSNGHGHSEDAHGSSSQGGSAHGHGHDD
jgi:hypothetical protein